MKTKTENRATEKEIERLIKNYSTNGKVLDILYTGKINTPIMLEYGLKEGIVITKLSGGLSRVTLPECRNGNYLCNDKYSSKMHMAIVRKILTAFINNNPQYFTLKSGSYKYAITDQFVLDLLTYNKNKEYDHEEFLNLLPLISNFDIFTKIAKIFYLPYAENETFDYVKRKYWQKKKPFAVKSNSDKCASNENYIMYGSQIIQSMNTEEFLKEMILYYNKKIYHTVAYCTYFPDNLIELFPLCKIVTFQSVYDHYREYKPQKGSKEKMCNDRESIIFPKYSIVDCQQMPTLWSYKKIFEKFVAEEAGRFTIFVNYHAKEVFHGAGGIGHNIFTSGN